MIGCIATNLFINNNRNRHRHRSGTFYSESHETVVASLSIGIFFLSNYFCFCLAFAFADFVEFHILNCTRSIEIRRSRAHFKGNVCFSKCISMGAFFFVFPPFFLPYYIPYICWNWINSGEFISFELHVFFLFLFDIFSLVWYRILKCDAISF